MLIMSFLLLLMSVALKIFPPKKPNRFYGYQGWIPKEDAAKWNYANKLYANLLLILSASSIALIVILRHFQQNDDYIIYYLLFGIIANVAVTEIKKRQAKL